MDAPKRILVIDDDPDFNDYVRIVLEASGYEVTTVQSLQQGLDALRQAPPDLVISDVMLARSLNGLSISHEIKSDERLAHIPLLMVSAIISEQDDDLLPYTQEGGAAAFLSKPITPAMLLERIIELLPSP